MSELYEIHGWAMALLWFAGFMVCFSTCSLWSMTRKP